ncbi:helix-turn-helix transcriptional regulator [Clostridium gasigenes]|uniref:helix-turn-helix transcriptional regulator n=1 Tax=Clostridium gasigenes TaxID=94869 RepID=UPI00162704BE|nr:helix-turn-helix transcriptional regulator [Clostridium gasigenes]MBB6625216.1 helix-turn-helix transcriptional regulator [Clostridium gasigenes]MBU3102946.1 helix-turn-helix domain-containing protein [Clostridium gasigenes]
MNENLLKSKRVLRGFTQKDLAKNIGVSEKTFNHKEQGKIVFKPNEIIGVSDILKLTISEINEIFFNNNLPIV